MTSVSVDMYSGPASHRAYSRKKEEFAADFCLVSRRTLDPEEYDTFRYFFLLGASVDLCLRRTKLDRVSFYRHVRSIELKLGRAFTESEPYPLFPLDNYFNTVLDTVAIPVRSAEGKAKRVPLLLSA